MRGIYNSVTDIRRKVFAAIAKMAYDDNTDYAKRIEEIPYEILPGAKAKYRNSIFLERAIIGERLRLGMGLPVREMSEYGALSDGIEESTIAKKYYDDPLINIVKFACNACPEKKVFVTNHPQQRDYFSFYEYSYQLEVEKQNQLIPKQKDLLEGLKETYCWYSLNKGSVVRKDYISFIDSNFK